jgi:hypothetical protein
MRDPHTPHPSGLSVTTTEEGALCKLTLNDGTTLILKGLLTEDEASACMIAALRRLAQLRGVEPRLVLDRDNPAKLRERLGL